MSAPETQATATNLAALRETAMTGGADQRVDFFTERGFKLAQRLAHAFSTSNAVPNQFRAQTEKRDRNGVTIVDNPSAMGNCLVAIETAQAVGMSITAVMQQANVIEGRLSWSGKFVIAAINASKRFTPLRFDIKNHGKIKATYKEKQGWNKEKNRFDFTDVTVEVENLECIAWAYTIENGRPTKERIEGAPVSMLMAVEEGWYGKSGSKWQTSMRHLMLQYRAGSFFGNIHAPDVVMGMGRSTEEVMDTETVTLTATPDGAFEPVVTPASSPAPKTVEELRPQPDQATDVQPKEKATPDPETGEVPQRTTRRAPPPPAEGESLFSAE